jgi:hypothetical protein
MVRAAQQVEQGFVVVFLVERSEARRSCRSRSKSAATKRSASNWLPASSSMTPGCCSR